MEKKDALDRYLDARFERIEQRASRPYDGVLGVLPEWLPEKDRRNFVRIRDNILERDKRYTPERLRLWVLAYCHAGEDGWITDWPHELEAEIGQLAEFYAAVRSGMEAGRKFVLGEELTKLLQRGEKVAERMKGIQARGVEANSEKADLFFAAVKDYALTRYKSGLPLKATHIAKEIHQQIMLDVNRADKDKKFPTNNGAPYSERHTLDTTRKALKALRPA